MSIAGYDDSVFVNCPFDPRYLAFLRALVFTVHDTGFVARCALDVDDSSDVRIAKIYDMIRECRYGIHDICRTERDGKTRLPRFNMPLELGIFLGAKKYGGAGQDGKRCLILDKEPYRYQKFCSDISGQDIRSHDGRITKLVIVVRDWLRQWITERGIVVPGGEAIYKRYRAFQRALPLMCEEAQLNQDRLPFIDYQKLMIGWLKENSRSLGRPAN